MSVPALKNFVFQEGDAPSLSDLLDGSEEHRQAKLLRLKKYQDELNIALNALRRNAREGEVNLESELRSLRLAEKETVEDIREIENYLSLSDRMRGVLQSMQDAISDEAQRSIRVGGRLRAALQSLQDAISDESDLPLVEILHVDQAVLSDFRACREDLEILRKQRLEEYTTEWLAYLSKLKEMPEYVGLAPRVEEFWLWVSSKLWAPEATPTDDGFLLIWDRDEHHLQVELFYDGSYDWFYRNRDDDKVTFEEGLPFGRWTARFKAAVSALRGS